MELEGFREQFTVWPSFCSLPLGSFAPLLVALICFPPTAEYFIFCRAINIRLMSANYSKFMDTNRNLIILCWTLRTHHPQKNFTSGVRDGERERESNSKFAKHFPRTKFPRILFSKPPNARHNSICAHRQILITLLRTLHCTTTPYNSSFTVQC